MRHIIRLHRHQNETRSGLRNAKITSLQHAPVRLIAKLIETFYQIISVFFKLRCSQSLNIFEHDSSGFNFGNYIQCRWKHVTLIVCTELLSSDTKRRTRHSPGNQINIAVSIRLEIPYILLQYVPVRPIQAECSAKLRLVFHNADMLKSCTL